MREDERERKMGRHGEREMATMDVSCVKGADPRTEETR